MRRLVSCLPQALAPAPWRALASSAAAPWASATPSADAIVVGAGHNGLVAATLLGRQGLKARSGCGAVAATRLEARRRC